MSDLLSKHLTLSAIKNVLSLHVLLDYFNAKKLHQITNGTALAATMFQANRLGDWLRRVRQHHRPEGRQGRLRPRTTAASSPPCSSSPTPFRTTSLSFRSHPFSPPPKPRLRRRGRARSTSPH
ncbi:FASCICLIN-like arabinogalactan 1 [Perilla frutescens var. frutescens]|nr:FASCICLIN-like arabinogalactan 1 [Perilla frutescens var. frutescens]